MAPPTTMSLFPTAPLLRLPLAGWLVGLALSACGPASSSSTNTNPECVAGQAHCRCAEAQRCDAQLVCFAKRCIPESMLGSTTQSPSASASTPSSAPSLASSSSESLTESSASEAGLEREACSDGRSNFRETDRDCGGPICERCELNFACAKDNDCASTLCLDRRCVGCKTKRDCFDQNSCTQDLCLEHRCVHGELREGSPCDDQDPCTSADECREGLCIGRSSLVLAEDFDRDRFDWEFVHAKGHSRSLWRIAPTKASTCDRSESGEDPAEDHSPGDKNGVAGVAVGGCHDRPGDGEWDCLWSKKVDVSFFDRPILLSFWRHLHSPGRGPRGVTSRVVYRADQQEAATALFTGFPASINDPHWILRNYKIPKGMQSLQVGICYQVAAHAKSHAGWSIDDLKLRQVGCLPGE